MATTVGILPAFAARVARRVDRVVLVLAALALCLLPYSCGARIPPTFAPAPPRISVDDMTFPDLSARDRIVILAFGDAGTGSRDQYEVGRRMAATCATLGCDLAVVLGDNFYNRGVRPPRDGVWDEAFERKFEQPYNGLGDLKFWAVPGNHDWHRGRTSVDTEVAYTLQSPRWRMPAYDYAVPGLPGWIHIYGISTTVIDKGIEIGQLDRAEAEMCSAPGWRLLAGHHPVYSSGHHADDRGELRRIKAALLPLIERCDIDVYMSGHEHHQEHLSGGFQQIVQGAAAQIRGVDDRPAGLEAEQMFAASRLGFAVIVATIDALDVTFFGYPSGDPAAFGEIYRAPLGRRSAPARHQPTAPLR